LVIFDHVTIPTSMIITYLWLIMIINSWPCMTSMSASSKHKSRFQREKRWFMERKNKDPVWNLSFWESFQPCGSFSGWSPTQSVWITPVADRCAICFRFLFFISQGFPQSVFALQKDTFKFQVPRYLAGPGFILIPACRICFYPLSWCRLRFCRFSDEKGKEKPAHRELPEESFPAGWFGYGSCCNQWKL